MAEQYRFDFCIASFSELEQQLMNCVEYIPFIDANTRVLSPKFVPLIFEACSLIDSIFREMSGDSAERYNLKKYSEVYEPRLELDERASLFLVSPLRLLLPYKGWANSQPDWWLAYNSLKHDRLNNYEVANYTSAVSALAALHQLMASFKEFIAGFLRVGWISTTNIDVVADLGSVAHLGPLHPSPPSLIIESRLFVSPTRENFITHHSNDPTYFEVDYDVAGLSQRIRDLLFAHEDW